jgi:tetratricopeptide (TPR) repeat protein
VRVATEAFKSRDRDAAAAAIAKLIEDDAPIGSTWGPISRMAKALHEVNLAIAAQKKYAADAPADRTRIHDLGALYMHFGLVNEAIALGEELAAKYPEDIASHQFIGTAYSTAGQTEKALAHFRDALRCEPTATGAFLEHLPDKMLEHIECFVGQCAREFQHQGG